MSKNYRGTGKEAVINNGVRNTRIELVHMQRPIDRITRTKAANEEVEVTLRELLGRKVPKIKGKRFKFYVENGMLNNIYLEKDYINESHKYIIK